MSEPQGEGNPESNEGTPETSGGTPETSESATEIERIPETHPRYDSLLMRHRIEEGFERGVTHEQGLIAEGRGEAFDYLLGERTLPTADAAARAAAAQLLRAEHPVISVNGNVAALVPEELVELAEVVDADLEVNLFNRTEERIETIAAFLEEHGAENVKGRAGDARLPNIDHERAQVDHDGIYTADTVLVPLEDGDRAEALRELGKTEIVIDLNPLSRSPQMSAIPIIDNIIRALPNVTDHARDLRGVSDEELAAVVEAFDREAALEEAESAIRSADLS